MSNMLQVSIVEWVNLKDMISVMLTEKETIDMKGAAGYKVALLEMCNWGSSLTRSDYITSAIQSNPSHVYFQMILKIKM